MIGALLSGLAKVRIESAMAKAAAEEKRYKLLRDAMMADQMKADEFMKRHKCSVVIIKPNGEMVAGS